MGKSGADRIREYRRRQKEAGLVEVRMWVRPDQVDLVKDIEDGLQQPPPSPEPVIQTTGTLADNWSSASSAWVVVFDGKPDAGLRNRLHAAGFRFEPDLSLRTVQVWIGNVADAVAKELQYEITLEASGIIKRV
jgi:hypothetical protein